MQPPVPVLKWNGIKDASKYGNQCGQLVRYTNAVTGDEDCLFLNVFVPEVSHKLSLVMIRIRLIASNETNQINSNRLKQNSFLPWYGFTVELSSQVNHSHTEYNLIVNEESIANFAKLVVKIASLYFRNQGIQMTTDQST